MASSWLRSLTRWIPTSRGGRPSRRAGRHRARPCLEPLEARLAPATHTWTGKGPDNLRSDPANWNTLPWLDPSSPSNPRIIVFNNDTTTKDDLPAGPLDAARVDQIKFAGSNNTVLGTGSN